MVALETESVRRTSMLHHCHETSPLGAGSRVASGLRLQPCACCAVGGSFSSPRALAPQPTKQMVELRVCSLAAHVDRPRRAPSAEVPLHQQCAVGRADETGGSTLPRDGLSGVGRRRAHRDDSGASSNDGGRRLSSRCDAPQSGGVTQARQPPSAHLLALRAQATGGALLLLPADDMWHVSRVAGRALHHQGEMLFQFGSSSTIWVIHCLRVTPLWLTLAQPALSSTWFEPALPK